MRFIRLVLLLGLFAASSPIASAAAPAFHPANQLVVDWGNKGVAVPTLLHKLAETTGYDVTYTELITRIFQGVQVNQIDANTVEFDEGSLETYQTAYAVFTYMRSQNYQNEQVLSLWSLMGLSKYQPATYYPECMDWNGDGYVNFPDFAILISEYDPNDPTAFQRFLDFAAQYGNPCLVIE